MKNLTQLILLLTGLAVFAMTAEKRSVSDILDDITSLIQSVQDLDSAVNSLPEEGTFAAPAIDEDFNNIISLLQKTLSDVTSTGQLDSADASSVIAALETAQPIIVQTLNDIVAQKGEVEELNNEVPGITQLTESSLIDVEGNTTAVENAIISVAPPTASSISSSIGAAFQTAIAAYAD